MTNDEVEDYKEEVNDAASSKPLYPATSAELLKGIFNILCEIALRLPEPKRVELK